MKITRLMKASLASTLVLLGVLVSPLAQAEAQKIHMVHQTSDVKSSDVTHMFRFEPDYLRIQPGDTVRFTGSMGQHTVTTVKGMLPEGAKPVEIHSIPSKDIKFDVPGVYGLKCRVHNRYGMVALLVVGDPSSNLQQARKFRLKRFGKKRMNELLDQLEHEEVEKLTVDN